MRTKGTQGGFSLIEVVIVAAIVGITVAVAVPSYRSYTIKTKRAAAQADLMELSHIMERRFTAVGRYDEADDPGTYVLPFATSPKNGGEVEYNLAFDAIDTISYVLEATPTVGQDQDTHCGVISITEAGVKCILGGDSCTNGDAAAQAAVEECW
ncbi:MAG: prepilin-type N-terminal cleavage/methylation domain-containing protein [Gammaproteobacteria bacterium]|nr:prepilin-type N-terminal cleavage/methylation domain-containing protein [Gammaproteobacteria bacterium]